MCVCNDKYRNLFDNIKTRVGNQRLGDADAFGGLIVLQQRGHDEHGVDYEECVLNGELRGVEHHGADSRYTSRNYLVRQEEHREGERVEHQPEGDVEVVFGFTN